MAAQTIRREQRLRRFRDFKTLRKRGAARAHPLIVLRAAPNELPYSRFGFVVSKRVSKLAVIRNRVRRRMKETVRRLSWPDGWDLLIIARGGAGAAPFSDLRDAIVRLAVRLGLLPKQPAAPALAGADSDA